MGQITDTANFHFYTWCEVCRVRRAHQNPDHKPRCAWRTLRELKLAEGYEYDQYKNRYQSGLPPLNQPKLLLQCLA